MFQQARFFIEQQLGPLAPLSWAVPVSVALFLTFLIESYESSLPIPLGIRELLVTPKFKGLLRAIPSGIIAAVLGALGSGTDPYDAATGFILGALASIRFSKTTLGKSTIMLVFCVFGCKYETPPARIDCYGEAESKAKEALKQQCPGLLTTECPTWPAIHDQLTKAQEACA